MEKIIERLRRNGYKVEYKELIDISLNGKQVVTIFTDDEYLQFHEEFTQIGIDIPELNLLINSTGYQNNHT